MSCVALKDYADATFNGFTKRLRPKQGAPIIPEYAAYFFRGPKFRRDVSAMSSLSTRASLNNEMLGRLSIVLPPVEVQKAIGSILKPLDDKIELNRRMNETLEAMARALFKSWFIDFDPVRAKADGRKPEGMDEATANLFPDSFEESELGTIPKGWKTGTFGDTAVNPRRGVQPRDIEPSTPYIGLEHIPRRSIALPDWGCASSVDSDKSAFLKGEVIFGKLRPYFHKVAIAPVSGVCSTDILVLAPKKSAWFGFMLGHASSVELVDHTDLCSTGTKMPRTNWGDISRFELVLPSEQIAEHYSTLVQPLINHITTNIHESRALAATRDALLPKLLSGELRVRDAERFVEGST